MTTTMLKQIREQVVDLICDHYLDNHAHLYPLVASMSDGYPEEVTGMIDEAILALYEVLEENNVLQYTEGN